MLHRIPGRLQTRISRSGWNNARVAKTANYTATNAENAATIALGGSAYFTLTFDAASGYANGFTSVVVNEDAGRAKLITVNGYGSFYLWPKQSAVVYAQNNAWFVIEPGRWRLPGDITMNVNFASGSNSNAVDGFATGAGAFASATYAYSIAQRFFDFNNFYVTALYPSGTLSPVAESFQGPVIGSSYGYDSSISTFQAPFRVKGASQTATILSTSTISRMFLVQSGAAVAFEALGINMTTAGAEGITCIGAGFCDYRNIDFGPVTAMHIHAVGKKAVMQQVTGNRIVSGTVQYHGVIEDGASLYLNGDLDITGASPTWTTFLEVGLQGMVDASGFSFSGTASATAAGKRCNVANLGLIYKPGGGLNTTFPGNAIGTADAATFGRFAT